MIKKFATILMITSLVGCFNSTPGEASVSDTIDSPVYKNDEKRGTLQKKNVESSPSSSDSVTEVNTKNDTEQVTSNYADFELQVVDLTNKERINAGLKPLEVDDALMKNAQEKSLDMYQNQYFSHTSPTLGSPFEQMKKNGISYNAAGENIAKGQKTPEEVVAAWMNSPGHKANIMDEKFTHIGVGYYSNGSVWTQQFIKK